MTFPAKAIVALTALALILAACGGAGFGMRGAKYWGKSIDPPPPQGEADQATDQPDAPDD